MIILPSSDPAADCNSQAPLGTFSTLRTIASTVAGFTKNAATCSSGMSDATGLACRGRDHGVLGPVSARAVDDRDAFAQDQPTQQVEPRPQLVHDPHALETRSGGQFRQHPITPPHHQQVGRIHRAGDHLHPHLSRPRFGRGDFSDLKDLGRLSETLENKGFHETV